MLIRYSKKAGGAFKKCLCFSAAHCTVLHKGVESMENKRNLIFLDLIIRQMKSSGMFIWYKLPLRAQLFLLNEKGRNIKTSRTWPQNWYFKRQRKHFT